MKFKSDIDIESLSNATTDTDRFVVSDGGILKYRTGAQVLSDIGGQAALTNPITGTGTLNFVPKFTSTGSTLGNSLIFDNGTNVGIGTTSPDYKLEVIGDIATLTGNIILNSQDIYANREYSGNDGQLRINRLGYLGGTTTFRDTTIFNGKNSAILSVIGSTGNVGIGITNPGAKLNVYETVENGGIILEGGPSVANLKLTFKNSNATANSSVIAINANSGVDGIIFQGLTDAYSFTRNIMTVLHNGNVGIGTTSPAEKLHVVGNGLFTGTLEVDTVNNGVGDFLTRTAGGIITRRTAAETLSDLSAWKVVNLTVNTARTTAAKTSVETVVFEDGVVYAVNFTLGTAVSNATLNGVNIQLGNYNVSTITLSTAASPVVIPMRYNSSLDKLSIFGSYNINDSTEDYNLRWENSVQAGVEITRHKVIMEGIDGRFYPLTIGDTTAATKTVSTQEFRLDGTILVYNTTATVAANAVFTNVYVSEYFTTTNYTFNQSSGFTAYRSVYLVGTINSNGNFVLDNTTLTSWLTQTLPTTDDGKVYIYLGITNNTTTAFRLDVTHPIYQYKNGKLGLYSSIENPITGTGTTNYLPKFTSSTSLGNSLVFDDGTNVGIGTTSPQDKLDVRDSLLVSNTPAISNGTSSTGQFDISGNVVYFGSSNTGKWRQNLQGWNFFSGESNLYWSESLNGGAFNTRMYLSSLGLTVVSDIDTQSTYKVSGNTVITNGRLGIFADGTAAAPAYSFSNDTNNGMYRITTDTLGFSTAGTEKLRISSAGNVSIGNANNTFKLDVSGTGRFTDNVSITTESRYFQTAGAFAWGNSTTLGVRIGTDNVTGLIDFRRWLGSGTLHQVAAVRQVLGGSSRYGLGFLANDISTNSLATTVRMYIDPNNGNVGIGTTNPSSKLEVAGNVSIGTTTVAPTNGLLVQGNASIGGSVFGESLLFTNPSTNVFHKVATLPSTNSGTYDSIVIEGVINTGWGASTSIPFKMLFGNRNGNSNQYFFGPNNQSINIEVYLESNNSRTVWVKCNSNSFSYITINVISSINVTNFPDFPVGTPTGTLNWTSNSNTPTTYYDMSNNRLGIKTTTPGYDLDVTGTIRATGDVIAFSDVRLKENINTIENALDKVIQLRGVEYNKIGEEEKSIGVIAQEVEKILPQVVKEDENGMKSVAYGNIVGVLIEALKEQQKQIEELKMKIDGITN